MQNNKKLLTATLIIVCSTNRMDTIYFKRNWNETTGDILTDDWGTSIFYFEVDKLGNVLRQIELYEKGQCLKYDTDYLNDKFGGLSEFPLDLEEFQKYKIDGDEFENVWESYFYKKFPEIVCTIDTLQGSPRLEGRRLSVGDIVSILDINNDINVLTTDYGLNLQQIRQTLNYCFTLQCKEDKPNKFCHNCTLRIQQDNLELKEEQDNWVKAKRLFDKYFKEK